MYILNEFSNYFDIMNNIEYGITLGKTVILENINDQYDSIYEDLLNNK